MLLEVQLLYFLPTRHHTGTTAELDPIPGLVKICVLDCTNVIRGARERDEIISGEGMVVVLHCIGKSTHDGFGNG